MSISEISSSESLIFEALEVSKEDSEKGLFLIEQILNSAPENTQALKAKIQILTNLCEEKKAIPGCSKTENIIKRPPIHWVISSIEKEGKDYIIKMENGTIWKFIEDPGVFIGRITTVPDVNLGGRTAYVQEKIKSRSDDNIHFYKNGTPLLPCYIEGYTCVFADVDAKNPIGCQLIGYDKNKAISIADMDAKGHILQLSNGFNWYFSWWQQWTTWNWKKEDSVLPFWNLLINLDFRECLLKK